MAQRSSAEFLSLLAKRRTYYALTPKSPISDSKIKSILGEILQKVPSAFNVQSTRMVLVVNDQHRQLWDIVKDIMHAKLGDEKFPATGKKLDGFRAGYGTVLFYDDPTDLDVMKAKFKTYRDHFDEWSDHSSGMHQLATWTALELEGFGANLQHYNPLIDKKVAEAFDVPTNWHLKSQMVFGTPVEGYTPDHKDKKDLSQTLFVRGAHL